MGVNNNICKQCGGVKHFSIQIQAAPPGINHVVAAPGNRPVKICSCPPTPKHDGDPCPHCPDGHEHPLTHPWSVHVGPQRDGDGQPLYLMVAKTGLQHVAEADAEWLRQLIRDARAKGR